MIDLSVYLSRIALELIAAEMNIYLAPRIFLLTMPEFRKTQAVIDMI